jgi:hypothetical protein
MQGVKFIAKRWGFPGVYVPFLVKVKGVFSWSSGHAPKGQAICGVLQLLPLALGGLDKKI